MSDDRDRDALSRLTERLDRAQSGNAGRPTDEADSGRAALGMGYRIGIEFVVAIIIATGLGWAIDRAFGTRPFGIIALFFLGVAAAMLNVYRAIAGLGGAVGYRRRTPPGDRSEGGR
jgi:ATP synthase protein I